MEKKEDFQQLIRDYITNHTLTSITYYELRDFFNQWITAKYTADIVQRIQSKVDWESWVRKGGANPPGVELNFTTAGQLYFENLADQYIALAGNASPANYSDYLNVSDP